MTVDKSTLNLPACLIIMDGFGLEGPGEGNAIATASTPTLDKLFSERPFTRLEASGEAVGLPAGQMGNSEVGHLNIGAGRIVHQELSRINKACRDGELESNPILKHAFESVVSKDSTLHFMGLLSDGGVHSSNEHLYALLRAAKKSGVKHVAVHCFLDGRDVPPESGSEYVQQLVDEIAKIDSEDGGECDIQIVTVMGRYYAMDRDNRWDRVQKAYDAIVRPDAVAADISPVEGVEQSYSHGVTDEFMVPLAFASDGVKDGDAIVFFNFRPDRARELTRAIVDDKFDHFDRGAKPDVDFVCLTEYDPTIDAPVAFAKEFPENVLADVLADAGLSQFHIAETEKYAHVTFFLNGGKEEEKHGEIRKLIASPKVATYDLQPEMSEPEVASTLAEAIRSDAADVYIVNFANCDMVGHTGVIPATVKAVEAVDSGVGEVLSAMAEKGGITLLTADHGNADKMLAEDGTPFTAHTTAKVPFVLIDETSEGLTFQAKGGKLADIAPTLLQAIGLDIPSEMTGDSLLA